MNFIHTNCMDKKDTKKVISIALITAALISVLFLSYNAMHSHAGERHSESCPICFALEMVEETVFSLFVGSVICAAYILKSYITAQKAYQDIHIQKNSLISLKVRLDD